MTPARPSERAVESRPELGWSAGPSRALCLPESFAALDHNVPALIPLVTPGYRKRLAGELGDLGFSIASGLIDPTAIVASTVRWREGLLVNAGVVIGARCVFGAHVLINRSASLGHDVIARDYATFGPASVVCGSCEIGAGAFIGAGAVILPRVSVGRNAVVGAGAVIREAVPEGMLVAGNPGRAIKTVTGYNDVSV